MTKSDRDGEVVRRKQSVNRKTPHIGSGLDAFLKEEGIFEEAEAQAIREVTTWQRRKIMRKTEKQPKAQYEIRLNTKRYDAFVAALNAPGKPRPRLEKLFTTPSVLERPEE